MSRRWNKFWIGLVSGIVLPMLCFVAFYFARYSYTDFGEFLQYAFKIHALPKILSLCAIPNLIIFYVSLNREFWHSTRGIIAATLLCTLGVVAVKFFA